jgi:hypothetical protein
MNYEIIDTARRNRDNNVLAKVRYKGIGKIGYRNLTADETTTQQAYAGAKNESGAFEDNVEEYDGEKMMKDGVRLTNDENGIEISNYPVSERIEEIAEELGSGDHPKTYVNIQYTIMRKGEVAGTGPRRTQRRTIRPKYGVPASDVEIEKVGIDLEDLITDLASTKGENGYDYIYMHYTQIVMFQFVGGN